MKDKIIIRDGKKVYLKGGKEVSRKEWVGKSKIKALFKARRVNTMSTAGWPKKSYALAVNPGDQKEAYEASVKMGVPTHFDEKTGEGIFRSQGHYNKYQKAFGYFDRDAGYGNVTPK